MARLACGFVLIVLGLSTPICDGATWSVTPSNFQNAVNSYASGDTISMAAGTYDNMSIYLTKPVKLIGAGKGQTILRYGAMVGPSFGTAKCGVRVRNTSNVVIDGITIREVSSTGQHFGILVEATIYINNITINNCEVRDVVWSGSTPSNGSAIAVKALSANAYNESGASGYIQGLTLTWNDVYGCKCGYGESVSIGGHCWGYDISNNYIHDNDNIGIGLNGFYAWLNGGPQGGTISKNRVWNCSNSSNPSYVNSAAASGIYLDGVKWTNVFDNKTWNCDIGISLGAESTSAYTIGNYVYNNEVASARRTVFEIGGYVGNNDQGNPTGYSAGNTIQGNILTGSPTNEMINILKTRPLNSGDVENKWIGNTITRGSGSIPYYKLITADPYNSHLGDGWSSNILK
jgi:hypothetical protein